MYGKLAKLLRPLVGDFGLAQQRPGAATGDVAAAPIGNLPLEVRISTEMGPEDAAAVLQSVANERPALDHPSVQSPRRIEGAVKGDVVSLEVSRRGALGLVERNSFRIKLEGKLSPRQPGSMLVGTIDLINDGFVLAIEIAMAIVLIAFWLAVSIPSLQAILRGDSRGVAAFIVGTLIAFGFGSVVWLAIARSKRGAVADANDLVALLRQELETDR